MDENDELWIPKVKVLSDMIDHHIEEEEGEVFKAAKKVIRQRSARKNTQSIRAREKNAKVTVTCFSRS